MECKNMIKYYLKRYGYDGLRSRDGECGCILEDLVPCGGEYAMNCIAGYRVDCDCSEGCNFHIVREKNNE